MKIRVVSSKDEILSVKSNERIVHLSFRPSMIDVLSLVRACPKIETIQLSKSAFVKISKDVAIYCADQRIAIITGEVWGHRKDLNDYYEVPKFVIERISAMKAGGVPTEDIISEVVRKHRMSREQAEMIVRE